MGWKQGLVLLTAVQALHDMEDACRHGQLAS